MLNQTIEYSGPIEMIDDDGDTSDIVVVVDEPITFDEIEFASHGGGPAVYPYYMCTRERTGEYCVIWPSDIPEWYFTPDKAYPIVEPLLQNFKEDINEWEHMLWYFTEERLAA